MNLPRGRRLVAYAGLPWRWPSLERLGHAVLLRGAWWLVVAYTGRICWADLDAKIEQAYQRRRQG